MGNSQTKVVERTSQTLTLDRGDGLWVVFGKEEGSGECTLTVHDQGGCCGCGVKKELGPVFEENAMSASLGAMRLGMTMNLPSPHISLATYNSVSLRLFRNTSVSHSNHNSDNDDNHMGEFQHPSYSFAWVITLMGSDAWQQVHLTDKTAASFHPGSPAAWMPELAREIANFLDMPNDVDKLGDYMARFKKEGATSDMFEDALPPGMALPPGHPGRLPGQNRMP